MEYIKSSFPNLKVVKRKNIKKIPTEFVLLKDV